MACDRVRAAAAAAIFSSTHHLHQIRLLSAFSNFFLKAEMKHGFAFTVGRWGKAAVDQLQELARQWKHSLARI